MHTFILLAYSLVSTLSDAHARDAIVESDEHALLQTQLAVATPQPLPGYASQATKLLVDAKPLAWVHIPKAGTSLINSLTLLPGTCPYIARGEIATDSHEVRLDTYCPGSFYIDTIVGHQTTMGSLPSYHRDYVHHSVGMFRQPEQRIISAYYYEWCFDLWETPPKDIVEYAQWAQGMSVKMLTRVGDYPEWLGGPVTDSEVALADGRVKEAFVYVGITDQWDLSMCLLHAMFGGACRPADFKNSRAGVASSDEPYNTTVLNGFVDVYDAPVYAEALDVFERNLRAYGVSMESCRICFEEVNAQLDAEAAGDTSAAA